MNFSSTSCHRQAARDDSRILSTNTFISEMTMQWKRRERARTSISKLMLRSWFHLRHAPHHDTDGRQFSAWSVTSPFALFKYACLTIVLSSGEYGDCVLLSRGAEAIGVHLFGWLYFLTEPLASVRKCSLWLTDLNSRSCRCRVNA